MDKSLPLLSQLRTAPDSKSFIIEMRFPNRQVQDILQNGFFIHNGIFVSPLARIDRNVGQSKRFNFFHKPTHLSWGAHTKGMAVAAERAARDVCGKFRFVIT